MKMKRIKVLLLIVTGVILFQNNYLFAQQIEGIKKYSWVTRLQSRINNPTIAVGINSVVMKTGIGVDWGKMNTLPVGHLITDKEIAQPDSFFLFDGVAYERLINYTTELYNPEFISLTDIKNQYAPDFPLRYCVFIINNILITKDPRAFKIDKDFITSVHTFRPEEIETLTMDENVDETTYIIRIYTKDHIMRKGEAIQKYKMKMIHDDFQYLLD